MDLPRPGQFINADPTVYATAPRRQPRRFRTANDAALPYDPDEIFDFIRSINDPEHPMTLEELHVTQLEHIWVDNEKSVVRVEFTPTIPHCSMATLIGLCIRVRLMRVLPRRFKIDVCVREGTHQSDKAGMLMIAYRRATLLVTKQLNDKERVAAAMENQSLLDVVNQCVARAEEEAAQAETAFYRDLGQRMDQVMA